LYLNDHDETFPMGLAQVSGGYYNGEYPVPVDWRPSQASNPALIRAFQSHWSHALQPYIKSLEIYRCPSAIVLQARGGGVEADYANAVKPPAPVSYSYNGLLHGLPLAQVERPTQVILWWESRGKVAVLGFARTSPYLFCPIEPCQYRRCPTRSAEPMVGDMLYGDEFTRFGYIPPTSGTLWMHSRGAVFAYVDGSVRWHPVGRQVQPARTDWRRDPFALYSERGFPLYAWYDGCYPWHFRPDNQ
jgi:prepilin-type processing-associated H-X9-DG protein